MRKPRASVIASNSRIKSGGKRSRLRDCGSDQVWSALLSLAMTDDRERQFPSSPQQTAAQRPCAASVGRERHRPHGSLFFPKSRGCQWRAFARRLWRSKTIDSLETSERRRFHEVDGAPCQLTRPEARACGFAILALRTLTKWRIRHRERQRRDPEWVAAAIPQPGSLRSR